MGFAVADLPGQAEFGAVVSGLAPERLDDPALRQALYDLWIDRGVIVFRGLEGLDVQVRLSEVFGEPQEHAMTRGLGLERESELIVDIEYNEENGAGTLYEVDGERLGSWLPWHSDLVYTAEINHGGILRPVVVPERGGETGFIDQIAAYDALPDHLKRAIEDKWVIYGSNFNAGEMKFKARPVRTLYIEQGRLDATRHFAVRARSIHPMVYAQKETGRKVLNVSPWFADCIEGMETAEGDALLAEVIDHATRPARAYYHHWRQGDMVLWDNWRMLHCGCGVPPGVRRHMRRTTIHGDYGLGRVEAKERVTVWRDDKRNEVRGAR
jgi:taurine dioxygenase